MIRLRRAAREQAIKDAIRRLNHLGHYKMHTKGEICKAMGIKSTSRIRDILDEMAASGELVGASTAMDGYDHEIAIYGLPMYSQMSLLVDHEITINGKTCRMSDSQEKYHYPEDEGNECAMCGKPTAYFGEKMCASCRQVWNG